MEGHGSHIIEVELVVCQSQMGTTSKINTRQADWRVAAAPDDSGNWRDLDALSSTTLRPKKAIQY